MFFFWNLIYFLLFCMYASLAICKCYIVPKLNNHIANIFLFFGKAGNKFFFLKDASKLIVHLYIFYVCIAYFSNDAIDVIEINFGLLPLAQLLLRSLFWVPGYFYSGYRFFYLSVDRFGDVELNGKFVLYFSHDQNKYKSLDYITWLVVWWEVMNLLELIIYQNF